MPRLAIVTTHPIQYNAPLFARLHGLDGIDLMVFYTWSQTQSGVQYDQDFGRDVSWDVPLLEGYPYVFVPNKARRPGAGRFMGIVNPGIIKAIEDWGPDAILVYSWPYHSHLRVIRHFSGKVPLMFRGDSTLLDERPGIRKVARRLFLRWVYSHVDMALCVGSSNHAYYLAHGMAQESIRHVPHAVDNDRFRRAGNDDEEEARRMRGLLGITDEELVLAFCGKLEPKKDPACLVRVGERIRSPRLKFLFIGDGVLRGTLEKAVGDDGRYHFLGFQNQRAMPSVYKMADIVMLPSLYNETWGLAVNEAMACGVPVIVSDRVGCAPDMVDEGRSGWVFPPGPEGEERVVRILERILEDRRRMDGMRKAAFEKADSHSMDAAAQGVSDALKMIVERKKPANRS